MSSPAHLAAGFVSGAILVGASVVVAQVNADPIPVNCTGVQDGSELVVRCDLEPTPATTVPPTTTEPATTTTAPPTTTTTTSTTTTTTTTAPPPVTTLPPAGSQFVETFTDDTGLDRFDLHVFHRNIDVHNFYGFSGGTWTGDHDLQCGDPTTQRPLRFNARDNQTTRAANSFYLCRNHMMSSMGDVDGYSIVAFAPTQTFDAVTEVSFDVNLTNLGNRQWWKVGVLSLNDCPALDRRCMYSDVGAADLPTNLATNGRLIASWSGGLSGGIGGGMKIGNTNTSGFFSAGSDKATRYRVALGDNGNGSVTFTVAGISRTVAGSFPACPCRVVFYDHNYTPDKSRGEGHPFDGYTWHWDNIKIS